MKQLYHALGVLSVNFSISFQPLSSEEFMDVLKLVFAAGHTSHSAEMSQTIQKWSRVTLSRHIVEAGETLYKTRLAELSGHLVSLMMDGGQIAEKKYVVAVLR
jgi:hypothetical protein